MTSLLTQSSSVVSSKLTYLYS